MKYEEAVEIARNELPDLITVIDAIESVEGAALPVDDDTARKLSLASMTFRFEYFQQLHRFVREYEGDWPSPTDKMIAAFNQKIGVLHRASELAGDTYDGKCIIERIQQLIRYVDENIPAMAGHLNPEYHRYRK